jgi:Glutathione S-transferase, N-terminal domain
MGDPVLYGLSRSVYTRIARLALEEKGVRYTLEEVEIFEPVGAPAEHLVRHPFGRIPTASRCTRPVPSRATSMRPSSARACSRRMRKPERA